MGECAITLKTDAHVNDLQDILDQLRYSNNHKQRALYATCCLSIIAHDHYADHARPFWAEGLPHLANDRVVDVRIAVARAIHRAQEAPGNAAEALEAAFTTLQNDSEVVVREIVLERPEDLVKYRLPFGDDATSSDSSSITSSEDSDDSPPGDRNAYTLTAASLYKVSSEGINVDKHHDEPRQVHTHANGGHNEAYDSDSPDIYLDDDDDLDELDLTSSTLAESKEPSPEAINDRPSTLHRPRADALSPLASPLTSGEADSPPSPDAKSTPSLQEAAANTRTPVHSTSWSKAAVTAY